MGGSQNSVRVQDRAAACVRSSKLQGALVWVVSDVSILAIDNAIRWATHLTKEASTRARNGLCCPKESKTIVQVPIHKIHVDVSEALSRRDSHNLSTIIH